MFSVVIFDEQLLAFYTRVSVSKYTYKEDTKVINDAND